MEDLIFISIIAGVAALFVLDRIRKNGRDDVGEPGNVELGKPKD